MSDSYTVVNAARFMEYREEQRLANEVNADLGIEPVVRYRGPAKLSPREMAEREAERNDVLGVLEEELSDLRDIDDDRVRPPRQYEGFRIAKQGRKKRNPWSPKNLEAVGVLIYLVLVLMYKHKCSRKDAFRKVAETELVTEQQMESLFYTYATEDELNYLPYRRGISERHGKLLHSITVLPHRC